MWTETDRVRASGSIGPRFHPELRRAALFIPRLSLGPATSKFLRGLRERRPVPNPPALADVSIRDEYVEGPDGASLRIRIFSPISASGPRPAMLWMHGGGFVIGSPERDQAQNIELCRRLGIVVAAVNYRLGPDHPYPEPFEDCYQALAWLHAHARTLNIDTARIAVGGASAGAGLAAGLALKAHDVGELPIAFQLLIYPMIDDRTTLRNDVDDRRLRVWSAGSNHFGWRSYLGREPGGKNISAYAAPSRRKNLSGLPPAWIGVGGCDLFHDEDVAYAARLRDAGVPCTLRVVEGAFHAFDLAVPGAQVAADFRESYFDALHAFASDAATVAGALASPERRLSAA